MSDLYKKIEDRLVNQGRFYISLELDRIEKILALLENPQEKLKIIHIAGTNGKGSVSSMLAQILTEQGYKVGLYTSPHLKKYNERIKINNTEISDEDFYNLINNIIEKAENNKIHLTEFEILTAVMFEYFFKNNIDYAVIETGLGGRYDATNCIKTPLLSLITSVSKDHTERLGDTIEKIAFEKAGIIKENTPVIFDKNNSGAKVLTEVALKKKAKIYYPEKCEIFLEKEKNYLVLNNKKYELSLLGKYQAENGALVLCAVEVLQKLGLLIEEKSIKTGLKNVKWPCRFEYIKEKNIILDGCHNPDGANLLKESLDFYFPYPQKRIFVYTSLKNKDYKNIQKNLFTARDLVYHLDINSEKFTGKNDVEMAKYSINSEELKTIINKKEKDDLLIICGSLYALGNILGKIDICS